VGHAFKADIITEDSKGFRLRRTRGGGGRVYPFLPIETSATVGKSKYGKGKKAKKALLHDDFLMK